MSGPSRNPGTRTTNPAPAPRPLSSLVSRHDPLAGAREDRFNQLPPHRSWLNRGARNERPESKPVLASGRWTWPRVPGCVRDGFDSPDTEKPRIAAGWGFTSGGQGRGRTGDLSLFRRTLLPTELPGRWVACSSPSDPDGTRTRDLRRDRAAR